MVLFLRITCTLDFTCVCHVVTLVLILELANNILAHLLMVFKLVSKSFWPLTSLNASQLEASLQKNQSEHCLCAKLQYFIVNFCRNRAHILGLSQLCQHNYEDGKHIEHNIGNLKDINKDININFWKSLRLYSDHFIKYVMNAMIKVINLTI